MVWKRDHETSPDKMIYNKMATYLNDSDPL